MGQLYLIVTKIYVGISFVIWMAGDIRKYFWWRWLISWKVGSWCSEIMIFMSFDSEQTRTFKFGLIWLIFCIFVKVVGFQRSMKEWSYENTFSIERCTSDNFYWDIAKSARIGKVLRFIPSDYNVWIKAAHFAIFYDEIIFITLFLH